MGLHKFDKHSLQPQTLNWGRPPTGLGQVSIAGQRDVDNVKQCITTDRVSVSVMVDQMSNRFLRWHVSILKSFALLCA